MAQMRSKDQQPGALEELARQAGESKWDALPPVHLWNPPDCGDIGLAIRRDGSWWYQGSRITRQPLVRLFSRILRKDDDGRHYLVTPVEKVVVDVETAPFLAVRVDALGDGENRRLSFQTNLGDTFDAGPDNPICVLTDAETLEPTPLVRVRADLDALMTRPVFFELVELAETIEDASGATLRVRSNGVDFPLGPPGVLGA